MSFQVREIRAVQVNNIPKKEQCGKYGSEQQLGNVNSVDIEMEIGVAEDGVGEGVTKITLRMVPKFLVNAFNRISSSDGMKTQGLFRLESNQKRMNNNLYEVYTGKTDIPGIYSIHDVCSMVKRFLRDLKDPLISNYDLQQKLFKLGGKPIDEVTRGEFSSLFEPVRDGSVMVSPLDKTRLGTLGFIMRQLNRLATHQMSAHEEEFRLTPASLSILFAPNIFSQELPNPYPNGKKKKKEPQRRASQEDILNACEVARIENGEKARAVQLLIEKANWIGLTTNYYVARPTGRSSSVNITPNSRQPLAQDIVNLQREANKLEKRQSLKEPRISAFKSQKTSGGAERSASRVRDFMKSIKILKDPSSPRRDRSKRRETLPGNLSVASKVPLVSTPVVLDICEISPVCADDSPSGDQSGTTRSSRSQQRRAAARHPTPGRTTEKTSSSAKITAVTPRLPTTGRPARRATDLSVGSHGTGQSQSEPDVIVRNFDLRDNPVSMLGEDAFNAELLKQRQPERRRRHTTPVKQNALRRNQPNVIRAGLHQPWKIQRITQMESGDGGKENRYDLRVKPRSISVAREDELRMEYIENDGNHEAAAILEQKGIESRLRRANRKGRQNSQELPSTLEVATPPPALSTPPPSMAQSLGVRSVMREHKVTMVSVATSPFVIPNKSNEHTSATPIRTPGSAVVSSPMVVDSFSMSEESPQLTPTRRSIPSRQVTPVRSPPFFEMPSTPTPRNSPVSLRQQMQAAAGRVLHPDSPHGPTTIVLGSNTLTSPVPPPLPGTAPPVDANESVNFDSSKISGRRSSPRPALTAQHSLDSRLAANTSTSQFTMPLPRNTSSSSRLGMRPPLLPKPSTSRMLPPSGQMQRRGPSNSSIGGRVSLAAPDDGFANSDANKALFLNHSGDDDESTNIPFQVQHARLEPRPSVAFIKQNNNGMVQKRVNMFSMMTTMEPISGRSSSMSTRSSLGNASCISTDDGGEFSKPTAPPVSHGINMNKSRPSLNPSMNFYSGSPGGSPNSSHRS